MVLNENDPEKHIEKDVDNEIKNDVNNDIENDTEKDLKTLSSTIESRTSDTSFNTNENDGTEFHFNIKNRLDYNDWMYCEGCPKPLLRGYLHGLVACSIPVAWYFILENCNTLTAKLIFSFYIICDLLSYGVSFFYHVYSDSFGPDVENLVVKLDRTAIFLNVSGNFTPVCIFFMKKTGVYLLVAQWFTSIVGIFRIFVMNKTLWWEPLGVGAIALLFIPEMWTVMTQYEFWMTMASYVASLIGGVFTSLKINMSSRPDIWGYHENFHLFVTIAGIIVYGINYSLSGRASECCWSI
jgi:channel protein (hemolysin III family)